VAIELAFLDHSLVRLIGALDAILPVIALGRKQFHDFVDGARDGMAVGSGCVKDALADLEFVIAQVILRVLTKLRKSRCRADGDTSLSDSFAKE
jgi:hypothetical protein